MFRYALQHPVQRRPAHTKPFGRLELVPSAHAQNLGDVGMNRVIQPQRCAWSVRLIATLTVPHMVLEALVKQFAN